MTLFDRLRLGRSKADEADTQKSSYDFDNYVEAAFQLATYQGPMCGEPVEGLAYFLESLEIDREAIEQEIGMIRRHWTYPVIHSSLKSAKQDGPSYGVIYLRR